MTYNLTLNKENLMKLYLNSLYGALVYTDTDSIKIKENDMNKNYIVVHTTNDEVAIIFKDKIAGICRHGDGTADLLLVSGSMVYFKDKYADIIKQLI